MARMVILAHGHLCIGGRGSTGRRYSDRRVSSLIRRRADLRPLYEAAVQPGSPRELLAGLSTAAERVLEGTVGLGIQLLEVVDGVIHSGEMLGVGSVGTPHRFDDAVEVSNQLGFVVQALYGTPGAKMGSERLERMGVSASDVFSRWGGIDVGGITARVSEHDHIAFIFELDRRYRFSPHEERVLNRASLYLQLGAQARAAGEVGGALSSRGELLEGVAPLRPAAVWPALCSGRYSLAARGRGETLHYRLVENPRDVWPRRALSPIERKVMELSARGLSGKQQAAQLGLRQTVVSARLAEATAKLGPTSVLAAIRVVGGLLEAPRRHVLERVTTAERDVLDLVCQGLSNVEIAEARETSVRTIANQVAALLRKLDQPSRRGLLAFG
ncbi:MAG: helix-turn-helix transcriptional regulator [Myxococcaceae bacterium]|nr:helix-turn-helix transcriptional regulator [Myxococcaceae bacterium]